MGRQLKGLVCVLPRMVVSTGTRSGTPQTPGDDAQPTFQQIDRGGVWIPETWDAEKPPGQVPIAMTFR